MTLNERWTLLGTNTKASLSEVEHHIGYKIDITFRFQYTTAPFTSFQDLPDLVWFVDKKYKDKNQYSHSGMDMYKQKKSNSIFSIWDAKYIAAYYYSMAGDKNPQYSQVRVFDNEKKPLYNTEFPHTHVESDMERYVKFFFERQGGLLDITLSVHPHIALPPSSISLEKVDKFDIGFPGISVIKINQGIVVEKNIPMHVFVTCSDQIALAIDAARYDVS